MKNKSKIGAPTDTTASTSDDEWIDEAHAEAPPWRRAARALCDAIRSYVADVRGYAPASDESAEDIIERLEDSDL